VGGVVILLDTLCYRKWVKLWPCGLLLQGHSLFKLVGRKSLNTIDFRDRVRDSGGYPGFEIAGD